MKRLFLIVCAVLLLSSCAAEQNAIKNANAVAKTVLENKEIFLSCGEEMALFGEERIYVAMEAKEAKEGETLSEEEKKPRLVSFIKESDDREEIKNDILEDTLTRFGFKVIFFQTASDGKRCVIFSFAKENDPGIQNGFYFTPDDLPRAFWGRKAELEREGDRYLQLAKNGGGWYYTTRITENFYYFEKSGDLVA